MSTNDLAAENYTFGTYLMFDPDETDPPAQGVDVN